ncbi:MAG: TIGR03013 family PEP-CTERM/XrtA system glycosyltransferase [Gammaproteobacteria bacterium]|nr:TIGR03013 family PEP-CTERM/XrtA system glycosyltransferase [Gammaproteobacteria bacterium]
MSTVRFFRHSSRLFRYYVPTEFVLLAVIEFFVLMLSLYLALEVRFYGHDSTTPFVNYLLRAFLYAAVMQLSMVAFGLFQRQHGRFFDVLILRIGSSLLLGLIPLGILFYLIPNLFLGRGVLALTVFFSYVFISIIRLYFSKAVKQHNLWARVLVLGSGEKAKLIKDAEKAGELEGLNIIGYVSLSGDKAPWHDEKTIALDKRLMKYSQEKYIDEIVLAMDDRRTSQIPPDDLLDCKMSGIDIVDMATFFERRTGKIRLDTLSPSWLYLSDGFYESTFRNLIKRLFDIVITLLVLPLALPLALLVTTAIFLESRGRGPIFYSQTRIKQFGKPFQIYKFRSMVSDAEKDGVARWASKNDARITRIGSILRKGRLDELPQLFNILKGDMSFVGPRPERPEFIARLSEKIPYYGERHRVKPGLTGWAQISCAYADTEGGSLEKLQYDLYYVKNHSIFLDLLILLQTLEVVLLSKGAQ